MVPLPGNGGMILNPRPKERREDLFDREGESEALKSAIGKFPLTLLLGMRRVGKTSVLKVVLNEVGGVYIDARALYFASGGWITSEALTNAFERALNGLKSPLRQGAAEVLRRVKGVSVAGVSISFDSSAQLPDVLAALNDLDAEAVIAFDEAQYLRYYGGRGGKAVLAMIAFAYDNLENVRFVLSGSEVGLLHDFIGVDDYESPLYGRVYGEVTIEPFSRELSKEFLAAGLREAGVEMSEGELERATELLDGIPGWLVELGWRYVETRDLERALQDVIVKAEKFLKGELKELERRSRRYVLILKAIARGVDRWEMIKDFVSVRGGKIQNARLAELLRNLEKMGWIRKIYERDVRRYEVVDPVVLRVLRRL